MRILILTQYFLPEMGAPQSRLYELAKGLKKLNWDVSIVTAMPNYPTGRIFPDYRYRVSSTEMLEGLEVKRFWLYATNTAKILPRILSMLSFSITSLFSVFFIRSKKPDYILVESPPLTLAFSGWLLSMLSSSKLVLNISDLWPLSAKELGVINSGRVYDALEKFELFLYKKAFLCSGQSQEIVDYITKRNLKSAYLFRNGVDVSRFREDNFTTVSRNRLVYAGLLGVAQGVLSICQNIDFKLLDAEFHIYGMGIEADKIESFVRENPNRGVFYHGILTRENIPTVLSSYGGSLIPLKRNIYGAVPSKIYESLAAGLPIVFSGDGEGAEIINKSKAGWVAVAGNWVALKSCIREFIKVPEESYLHLRRNNKTIANECFNRSTEILYFSDFLISKQGGKG